MALTFSLAMHGCSPTKSSQTQPGNDILFYSWPSEDLPGLVIGVHASSRDLSALLLAPFI